SSAMKTAILLHRLFILTLFVSCSACSLDPLSVEPVQPGTIYMTEVTQDGGRIVRMTSDGLNRKVLVNGLLLGQPRGGKMAFIDPHDTSLYVALNDGSNPIKIASHPIYTVFRETSLSPDGTMIAYMVEPDSASASHAASLRVSSTDGVMQRTLSNQAHREASPSFSSDGGRIAFAGV